MTDADRDLVAALRAELAGHRAAAGVRPGGRGGGPRPRPGDARGRRARLAVRLGREPTEAGRLLDAPRRTKHARRRARPSAAPFDWDTAADHCRLAWLRGLFLARGSLSLAAGRAHLEFVVEPDEAPILAARLADLGLPASWRLRRGRGVVTWKSAETVVTFLRRIGAGAASSSSRPAGRAGRCAATSTG